MTDRENGKITGLDWWWIACRYDNKKPSESWGKELNFIQDVSEGRIK